MIYFDREKLWKLTDFGISGPALSNGVTTMLSRGTPCYRAPELYREKARFTDRVDMWALGCILYECFTGKKAFLGDSDVATYSQDKAPVISIPWPSQIWHNLLNSTVHHLLCDIESQRPTAATILDLLTSYKIILTGPLAEPIFSDAVRITYKEWNTLRARSSSEIEWLYELANSFKLQEEFVANVLLEEMVQQYLDIIQRLHESNRTRDDVSWLSFTEDPKLEKTMMLFKKILNYIPDWWLARICYEIARYLTSRGVNDWEGAIATCRLGMNRSLKNTILPTLLSNLYAESGYYDDAIATESRGGDRQIGNDLVDLESTLVGFYARILPLDIMYLKEIPALMCL